MRFVDYIANKNGPFKSARISIPEMWKSTEKIVQMVQRQFFSEEIDCLKDGRQVKGHSKLSNLSPVLIEGTIRVGGRIRHAPIPFAVLWNSLPCHVREAESLSQFKRLVNVHF